jgi:nucleotide-binding universal stress UspA family protein
MNSAVVVGVDGSRESLHAVNWAAEEAIGHRAPLCLMHAWAWHGYAVPPPLSSVDGRLREYGEQILAEAKAQVRAGYPDLEVSTRLVNDAPGPVLVAASTHASLVVLASRGHGGFLGLLLGSVGLHVAAHAHCPVAIFRTSRRPGQEPDGAEVVLGVDGRHPCPAAMEFAFNAAAARGFRLRTLHAWTRPPRPGVSIVPDWRETVRAEERLLNEALSMWPEKFPEVPVVREVTPESAAKALVKASDLAELLVVGARRRQGVLGMALGSVNHALLHHARCPVVLVPEPS